jgi:hypothetical protein
VNIGLQFPFASLRQQQTTANWQHSLVEGMKEREWERSREPAKEGPPAIEGPIVIERLSAIERLYVGIYNTEKLFRKDCGHGRLLSLGKPGYRKSRVQRKTRGHRKEARGHRKGPTPQTQGLPFAIIQ